MSEEKKRHGCLTVYLWLMVVGNSVVALIYLFGRETLEDRIPFLPGWALPVLAICAILNVVFAIALLRWKRWGFIGFIATAILTFVVNVNIRVGFFQAVLGLFGVAILYGVLQIGDGDKEGPVSLTGLSDTDTKPVAPRIPKGWDQLE